MPEAAIYKYGNFLIAIGKIRRARQRSIIRDKTGQAFTDQGNRQSLLHGRPCGFIGPHRRPHSRIRRDAGLRKHRQRFVALILHP